MSSSLKWKKVITTNENYLADQLKWILQKRHEFPMVVSNSNLDYFLALSDNGVAGSDDIIEAVKEHGSIELFLEY